MQNGQPSKAYENWEDCRGKNPMYLICMTGSSLHRLLAYMACSLKPLLKTERHSYGEILSRTEDRLVSKKLTAHADMVVQTLWVGRIPRNSLFSQASLQVDTLLLITAIDTSLNPAMQFASLCWASPFETCPVSGYQKLAYEKGFSYFQYSLHWNLHITTYHMQHELMCRWLDCLCTAALQKELSQQMSACAASQKEVVCYIPGTKLSLQQYGGDEGFFHCVLQNYLLPVGCPVNS